MEVGVGAYFTAEAQRRRVAAETFGVSASPRKLTPTYND